MRWDKGIFMGSPAPWLLEYLPTFATKSPSYVGVDIPAPWFAYGQQNLSKSSVNHHPYGLHGGMIHRSGFLSSWWLLLPDLCVLWQETEPTLGRNVKEKIDF